MAKNIRLRDSEGIPRYLDISGGGTGAGTAMQALSNLLQSATEYKSATNTTSNADQSIEYTVHGNGVVFASASVRTDTTSDTGLPVAYVYKNGSLYAFSSDRVSTAVAQSVGANASAFMAVKDGDKIRLVSGANKNGTKTIYRNLLAIGCTLT